MPTWIRVMPSSLLPAVRLRLLILHPSSFILPSRRGVTLIELLLVVTMILIMMGLAARQMQVAKDSRRNRETARAVSVYLGSARSTALANRRPCGVVLTLTPRHPAVRDGAAAGRSAGPLCRRHHRGHGHGAGKRRLVHTANIDGRVRTCPTLVHQGDVIQFNYEGPWYNINGVSGQI